MNLSDLGKTVAKYAPLLGAVLPVPGGAALGQAIAAVFGGDVNNEADLIRKIEQDPEAILKLKQIESSERIEIEKLAVERFKSVNSDRANAREANIRSNKLTDEIIKCYLVFALSSIVFSSLYALIQADVKGVEANIVSGILGSSFTALLSMVYFYWGTSKSSNDKDSFMYKDK